MPTWRMKTVGVPVRRPHYGDTPGNELVGNAASYMPAVPLTPEQATGGDVVVLGHRGMVSMSADPAMANYLPTTQIPSRWAPPVAGNVLVPVLTAQAPPAGVRNPNITPVHIPVPVSPPYGLAVSAALQRGMPTHGRRAATGLAGPTVTARPKFMLRGGGTTA